MQQRKDIIQNGLYHYGVLGMRWGVHRTPEQLARREQKRDVRWAKKNYKKIYNAGYKVSRKELNDYVRSELNVKYRDQLRKGRIGRNYINDYNRKLAQLMNTALEDIEAPSGKIVQFVAKRGEKGVHMALADRGYDMSQLKNGVYGSGRIAYRKKSVDVE